MDKRAELHEENRELALVCAHCSTEGKTKCGRCHVNRQYVANFKVLAESEGNGVKGGCLP